MAGIVEGPWELPAAALADVKGWLRISGSGEDALLAGLLRAATAQCEAAVGDWLVARDGEEVIGVASGWLPLSATPMLAINGLTGIPAEGAEFALPVAAFAIDIVAGGRGWLRIDQPGAAGRVRAAFRAGRAAHWTAVEEPLRQGIIRLAAHHYLGRDRDEATALPATVAALWRPWARLRLGAPDRQRAARP